MHHLVALSGGKDSTAMALRLRDAEPRDYEFCITPTGRELPDMEEHYRRIECLLGKPLIRIPGPSMMDLVKQYKALPNFRMRWCTRQIKIEPFQVYALSKAPAVSYVGIRADETDRGGADYSQVEGVTQDFPLARWGWDIADVRRYLSERGITIPKRTDCDMCFYQRLGEWWRLWRDHPDRWREAEALETWTGHTFRTDGRDSYGVSLADMRRDFESGRKPRGVLQMELEIDSIEARSAMCSWCAR